MKIFAFKEEELKEKTEDAIFSLPNKNPESSITKRIPDSDSKIGKKLGGFRIRIANPSCYTSNYRFLSQEIKFGANKTQYEPEASFFKVCGIH